jgi:hypothetical protein
MAYLVIHYTYYIAILNINVRLKNIAICPRWKESFLNFYEDLHPTFEEGCKSS